MKDALRPELQTEDFGFDQKGIWSGDVILDGGKAFAFYTSVNHSDRLLASNPGVAMAVREDADLEDWTKIGPILNTEHVVDFRDPYLLRSGGTWHMIIGAALETGGGLDYYVLRPDRGRAGRSSAGRAPISARRSAGSPARRSASIPMSTPRRSPNCAMGQGAGSVRSAT